MTDKKKKGAELSYGEANGELEGILQEIESGEIDLDLLSEKVERAAVLLSFCRDRLAATETKVKKVVADLHAAAGDRQGNGEATRDDAADDETAEKDA